MKHTDAAKAKIRAAALRRSHPDPWATLAARFWTKVDRRGDDECWPWLGAKNDHGYGQIRVGRGRVLYAHHAMLWLTDQIEVVTPNEVLHSCDNPACVNRRHLTVGTRTENMRDASAKGRLPTGHAHWNYRTGEYAK